MDHHNAGERRPLHVFLQTRLRVFEDATERFGIPGVAALAVACEDLDGDGELELVVANYRAGFEYDTDSFIYRRRGVGFAVDAPLRLPTHYAMHVELADLNGDGAREVIFAGGNQVQIYWNPRVFADATERFGIPGVAALAVACEDLDGDGELELVVANYRAGFEYDTDSFIYRRRGAGFAVDWLRLPTHYAMQVELADLNGDGAKEVIFAGGTRCRSTGTAAGASRPATARSCRSRATGRCSRRARCVWPPPTSTTGATSCSW